MPQTSSPRLAESPGDQGRFLPAAEVELLKGVAYYSKARAGTGTRFQAAVQEAVLLAARHPSGGAPSFKETRRRSRQGLSVQRGVLGLGNRVARRRHRAPSKAPALLGVTRRAVESFLIRRDERPRS
jgi:hypothetical protein